MAWLCNFATIIDLGAFYSTNPPLTGKIFNPPPGKPTDPPTDTATTNTATFTMTFPSTAAAPSVAMALLLQDPTSPTPGGDFFRWRDFPLPASPASLASYTIPAAATSFSTATLQTAINDQLPRNLSLDPNLVAGVGAATSGAVILKSVEVTSVSIAMTPPNVGFTALGSVKFGPFGVGESSVSFTLSATLSIQPSHDVLLPKRVLQIVASSPNFKVVGLEPNVVSLLQGPIADQAAHQLEDLLNAVIGNALGPAAAASGRQLTKTAVASAQRVVVGAGGMTLAIVIADLRGPALIPLPISIQVSVAPDPMGRSGKLTHYVVTVTDARTGAGVSDAEVKLTNFNAQRQTLTVKRKTNADGTCGFDAALRDKVVPHTGLDVAPSITVSPTSASPAFTPQTLTLDLTP